VRDGVIVRRVGGEKADAGPVRARAAVAVRIAVMVG